MYTLILCLFIACLLPYLSKIPMAIAMKNQVGGYDNNYPRSQQTMLTGFGARALAAHKNSFEFLIIFSAAVLTALAVQNTSTTIQYLAIITIISRVIYHIAYLMNWGGFRSSIWAVGIISSLSIIWLCLP
jgi:uncharacterized MAPEG superfamily protein